MYCAEKKDRSSSAFLQDFGDYQDGYYSVQTTEGEQIAQLIAGYIDIILKKVTASPREQQTAQRSDGSGYTTATGLSVGS